VHKKIAREKVKLPTRPHKGRYNDQACLRGMKFVEELHQARESGSRARRLQSHDHCIVIVTPPTAAEASSPTLGPLSCRMTPLAFCNCTPPAPFNAWKWRSRGRPELPEIAGEIVRDLRTQYVVSYAPTNKAHDGTYRSIKVGIADAPGQGKRIALTRSGRTAGQGSAAKPANKPNSTPVNNNVRQPATNTPRKSP